MQVIYRIADRVIVARGVFTAPPADPALALADVPPDQAALLSQPGTATLNQDGTVSVLLDATQQAAIQAVVAAQQAATAFRQAHQAALAAIKPAITANATQAGGDASSLPAIVTAILSGQPLTAAQQATRDRFFIRALIALGGI